METFVGDTIDIILETDIDVTGFSTLHMRYVKPDGTAGYWEAEVDPGDDTRLIYTTVEEDLDLRGTWRIQAFVQENGTRLHGKWAEFHVFQPLPIR